MPLAGLRPHLPPAAPRRSEALRASARFVPSCARVNTFYPRPSVHAQICTGAGRLGGGWAGGGSGGTREDGRRAAAKQSVILLFWVLRPTFCNQALTSFQKESYKCVRINGDAGVPTRTQTVCDTLKLFLTAHKPGDVKNTGAPNRQRLSVC